MKYPLLTPEKVTRDVTDIFGGYNHNLRIGDNEFYDMENLSSDSYPLLSVRKKRNLPQNAHITGIDADTDIKGALYSDKLYTIRRIDNQMFFCAGNTQKAYWNCTDSSMNDKPRTIIPMGSRMIIMPDKKVINLAETNPTAKDIDNEKSISTAITIQPCLADGTVLSVDYIGDEVPIAPVDGYVWGDTRNGKVALKKYIASQAMWQSFLSTYVKISAANRTNDNKISVGFNVGDGVKISGITETDLTDLNNVSIIKAIPDEYSLVLTGIVDPLPNHYLLTARWTGSDNTRAFYCDSEVTANEFAGKKILIGDNEYLCTSNTDADEITAEYQIADMDLVNEYYEHQSGNLTVDRAVTNSNIVYVDEEINRELFPVDKKDYQSSIMICFNQNTSTTATVLSYGSISESGSITYYLVLDKNVTVAVNDKIYPVEVITPDNKYATVLTFAADVFTVAGDKACPSVENQYAQTGAEVTFSRKMPKMDFVIENQNRLWGCFYGESGGEHLNEIYCSKLGDPTNWQVYEGVSTDSYSASCGTEGEWTGAFNYRGYPTFFKEHHIHTVYGSNPPFQIKDTEARGIQKGSSGSLALVNEVLFYKSIYGICAYTGSLPEEISGALGEESYHGAVGCAFKGKYYIEMQDSNDNPAFFIYDTGKGLWHKEAAINAAQMTAGDNNVYYIAPVNNHSGIGHLFGTAESMIRWYAETGVFGLGSPDKKYFSKINLRLMLPVGSLVFIQIEYDSSGVWERIANVTGHSLMPFSFSIKPRRCDHFRLRLEGIGDMKLYSVSKTIEQGSDR